MLTALATRAGCPPGACQVISDQRPGDIRDYAGVRDTSLVLGALLVVLAVGTLAHVLLTGVRRRRRDLAMLKTLGLSRGQVLRLVAWQAGAFGCVALLAGLPLGVLAGRQAWAGFAAAAGIAPSPDIPAGLILATIPATLLIAVLIALWPGWRATRLRPAEVLWTGLAAPSGRWAAAPLAGAAPLTEAAPFTGPRRPRMARHGRTGHPPTTGRPAPRPPAPAGWPRGRPARGRRAHAGT